VNDCRLTFLICLFQRAEVEKRVGVEREMFARQTAEYEEKILALEAEKVFQIC